MAEDAEILQRARDEARVVVTLDADFHALLVRSSASLPSVIRIRIEGLRAEALVDLLQDVFDRCQAELEQGALVTVQPASIRIRHLPLLA
jgi:predicted nuclease of predicted toxin-antitoxin system